MSGSITAPSHDCALCPRLVAYRATNRATNPGWFNAPVPSWGPADARFLVVGMAPGVTGANRTGRPFTGDYCGTLLYETLIKFGLARGVYQADPQDGVELRATRITNAARCVPPQNKLDTAEIDACNRFLATELAGLAQVRVILSLGVDSHKGVLKALGLKPARFPFGHGTFHKLPDGRILANSYHVSRYNTNTRRLTTEMFEAVIARVCETLRG
jgi:uracil-DNA glycosylase family 4